jgi:hypothetical protein
MSHTLGNTERAATFAGDKGCRFPASARRITLLSPGAYLAGAHPLAQRGGHPSRRRGGRLTLVVNSTNVRRFLARNMGNRRET